jgi:hypothetical protein
LDERRRRQWAAAEAREIGYGGVSVVARATGLARSTIHAGVRDLRLSRRQRVRAAERTRRAGGGRRSLTTSDPDLISALLALIEPTTRAVALDLQEHDAVGQRAHRATPSRESADGRHAAQGRRV